MSEEMLIRHCSPTLAGLKTANLVNCPCPSVSELEQQLGRLSSTLNPKGVQLEMLSAGNGMALVYVVRPDRLEKDLGGEAGELLCREGYPKGDAGECLRCLKRKLQSGSGFPHEIGLFLGYPPADVAGFIEHRGQGCKCVGAWKVYGDEQAAKKTFAQYKKCTDVYERRLREGYSVERLTVQGKPVN